MKKNMAIAMSAMMTAGAVVPTFAAEKTTQIQPVTVDARLARGEELVITTDGVGNKIVERKELNATANKTRIEQAKTALNAATKEIKEYANAQYGAIVNGQAVMKNTYTIQINGNETNYKKYVSTQNGVDSIVDTSVVYDVIDNRITDNTKKVVAKFTFKGLKRYDLSNSNFGQGEAMDQYKDTKFDFASANVNYDTLAMVKHQINRNSSILKLQEVKKIATNDKITYLEVKVMLTDGTAVATLTFENLDKYNKTAMAQADTLYNAQVEAEKLLVEIQTKGDIKSHWAKNQVLKAMNDGWVDKSATFRPQDQITRAEFVKVVNRAFGIVHDRSITKLDFKDVDANAWYYQDIVAARRVGYINGYTDNTFRPNQPITRQEAAKIIATLVNGKAVDTTKTDSKGVVTQVDVNTKFFDDAKIAAWSDESVKYLSEHKTTVINGYKEKIGGIEVNLFKPENNITRAEAVVMMQRAATAKNTVTN